MFLSGRTVEAHVANLGLGSRVQLSRWVAGVTEPESTRTKHSIVGTISLSQPVGFGHVAHISPIGLSTVGHARDSADDQLDDMHQAVLG